MDVRILQETPPWEWPRNARKILQKTLLDRGANEEDRVIAAGLAGDLIVMNDRMALDLLEITGSPGEPVPLRTAAANSRGSGAGTAELARGRDPGVVCERG